MFVLDFGGPMPESTKAFADKQAPCGRTVDGHCHEDRDEEGLVVYDEFFACGCRSIRHEFHDGSMSRKVVHHNGRVLVDEFISEHS
jgi:hypothetical protein